MGRWVERRVARLHGRLVIVIVRWGRVVGKLMWLIMPENMWHVDVWRGPEIWTIGIINIVILDTRLINKVRICLIIWPNFMLIVPIIIWRWLLSLKITWIIIMPFQTPLAVHFLQRKTIVRGTHSLFDKWLIKRLLGHPGHVMNFEVIIWWFLFLSKINVATWRRLLADVILWVDPRVEKINFDQGCPLFFI